MNNMDDIILDDKEEKIVSCDGVLRTSQDKDGSNKHPLIYLKVSNEKVTLCPYCGKEFNE